MGLTRHVVLIWLFLNSYQPWELTYVYQNMSPARRITFLMQLSVLMTCKIKFCPSARLLQRILDVCQVYAESHGIMFNCNKTVVWRLRLRAKKHSHSIIDIGWSKRKTCSRGGQLIWLEGHFENAVFSRGPYHLMQCFSTLFGPWLPLVFSHNLWPSSWSFFNVYDAITIMITTCIS